jgi:AbrB family looped-hinge helix DNA binding protein
MSLAPRKRELKPAFLLSATGSDCPLTLGRCPVIINNRSSEVGKGGYMSNLVVAPVTNKGQVTLPKSVRTILGLKAGPDMVAFRVERNGKVEIVPIEIKEKKTSPYSEEEWAKIEGLANHRGKSFNSAKAAKKYLKEL